MRSTWFVIILAAATACGGKKDKPSASGSAESAGSSEASGESHEGSALGKSASGIKASLGGGNGSKTGAFTPSTKGFKFQNYGNEIEGLENLTPTEIRRMFGDGVCADIQGDTCILTPPAERWMTEQNKGMDGGHCEGMASVALLMQLGKLDPNNFGAKTAFELDINGNAKLQHEVAYWFVTQFVAPMDAAGNVQRTPNEVIDKLVQAFQTNDESYTLGFYKRDGTGGHATTPYAIQDQGNDITWILHYDNNFPGEERHIEVNRKTQVWKYVTASDPSQAAEDYDGDADTKTLTISPTSVRVGKLQCPFCGDIDPDGAAAAKGSRKIDVEGDAQLLVTDDTGKRIGRADGKIVDEIPGATVVQQKATSRRSKHEPEYDVPAGHKLTMTLDGSVLKAKESTDLTLTGPGYTMGVYDVDLAPGEKDTIEVSPNWGEISYKTEQNETPVIEIGVEEAGADWSFEIHAGGETGGQRVDLALDAKKGTFSVEASAKDGEASYEVEIHRIDDKGEQVFKHKGVSTGAKDRFTFHYADWKGNGTSIKADVDKGEDGKIDETEDLKDEE
jgi:hypothetical protein